MRPGTLPHHWTCGFPHPAIQRSRFMTWWRRGQMEVAARLPWRSLGLRPVPSVSRALLSFLSCAIGSGQPPAGLACGGFSTWASFRLRGGDRSCHAPVSRATLCAFAFQLLIELCSFVLRPLALPGFRRASSLLRPLLTSHRLSAMGSLRVSAEPFPSRRLALPSPSMTLGLRLS